MLEAGYERNILYMQHTQHEGQAPCLCNDYVEMWLEGPILIQKFKPNTIIDLELSQKIVHDRLQLTGFVSLPLYVDMHHIVSIDTQARDFFGSAEATVGLTRMAFRVGNVFNRLFAQVFMQFSKPGIPVQFFDTRQEAIDWLLEEDSMRRD